MKIVMIGTGYVGLVSGACFAEVGNDVTCVDVDEGKIIKLKSGEIPIYEPGLDAIVERNTREGRLAFTTKLSEAIVGAEAVFIAVGTPPGEDGSADLSYVVQAARQIGSLITDYTVVIDKSTVPVGTAVKVRHAIQEELDRRGLDIPFDVVSNPEFLKEGAAIDDFLKPDRIVVGCETERAERFMRVMYRPFQLRQDRLIFMDPPSAEMVKYASNCMLATKISFINEIACICEKVGADVRKVRQGIGADSRIGYSFIFPGVGYGGSCFPKDVQALIRTARDVGVDPMVLASVHGRNDKQKMVLGQKIREYFKGELKGRTIGLLGLSFKPETDDMREAASVVFAKEMLEAGVRLQAYDPVAMNESRRIFGDEPNLLYCDDMYDACKGADALVLVTEWRQFRSPDFKRIAKLMNGKALFDGRNLWLPEKLKEMGFDYHGIGIV